MQKSYKLIRLMTVPAGTRNINTSAVQVSHPPHTELFLLSAMAETRVALHQLRNRVKAAAEEKAQAEDALEGCKTEHQAASDCFVRASKLADLSASIQDCNNQLTEIDASLDMSAMSVMVLEKVGFGLAGLRRPP